MTGESDQTGGELLCPYCGPVEAIARQRGKLAICPQCRTEILIEATGESGQASGELFCPYCGPDGVIDANQRGKFAGCPNCGMKIWIQPTGETKIQVFGNDASEVETVARQLSADAFARREASRLRSPWFSGLFYLVVVVVVIALLLAVGHVIAPWALPVVIVGAVSLVSVVGALQLRADDRLNERNFVKLMGDVLRRLPLVFARARTNRREDDEK